MKPYPGNNQEWAKEAYDALCLAHIYFQEEYSNPTEKEKLGLFSFAVPLAVDNRGIEDGELAEKASAYIYDKLSHDINPLAPGEAVHYSIRFLNAYLDAHVAFGLLPEEKVNEIMGVLDANYAIDIPV